MTLIDTIDNFGPIQADPNAEYVISQLANPFNNAMKSLQTVLNTPYVTPTDYSNAYNAIITQLYTLQNLSANGTVWTLDNGIPVQYYLPVNLAQVIDVVVRSLQAVGIGLNQPPPSSIEQAIVTWQNLKGYGVGQVLTDAIFNSGDSAIHSLQSMIELQYVKYGNDTLMNSLSGLSTALTLNKDIISNLTALQNVVNQVQINLSGVGNVTASPDQPSGNTIGSINYPPLTAFDVPGSTIADKLQYATQLDSIGGNGILAAFEADVAAAVVAANDPSINASNLPVKYLLGQNSFAIALIDALFPAISARDPPTPPALIPPATNPTLTELVNANAQITNLYCTSGFVVNQNNTTFSMAPTSLAQVPMYNLPSLISVIQGNLNFPLLSNNAGSIDYYLTLDLKSYSENVKNFITNNPNGYDITPDKLISFIQQDAANHNTFTNIWNANTSTTFTGFPGIAYILNNPTASDIGQTSKQASLWNSELYNAMVTGTLPQGLGSVTVTGQSAFGQQTPFPVITPTTVADVYALQSQLQGYLNQLTSPPFNQDVTKVGSLANVVNIVLTDLNGKLSAATTPTEQLQAVISWMMDGLDQKTLNKQGIVQGDLSQALSVAQSLNDSDKQTVNNYMYIFQSFYQSASNALRQLNQSINAVGDGMAS